MKTYIKLQTQLRNIKTISPKFTTAICSVGEKNKEGTWEKIYIPLNIYNPDIELEVDTTYNIVGKLGVKPKFNNYPAQIIVHVSEIKVV